MIRYKKYICFFFVFMMLLSITACAPEDPKESGKSTLDIVQNTSPIDTEKKNSDNNSSIGTLLAGTPSHVSKDFSENFTVDANVHVPNVQKADVLFAKYMNFDEQTLLSIFYSQKKPSKETNPADNVISYKDDSSEMVISNDYFLYLSEDFEHVKFPTDSFVAANDIFSANRKFDEVYVQESLSFMNRAEAFQTVSGVLGKLSIETTDNAEIYAIDSKTMQTQQEERIQEDIDYQKEMGFSPIKDPTDNYKTIKTFTQEDDFYILYFTMTKNKIPITQKSYNIMAGERTLCGSTARASFSKKGIIELDCAGIYQSEGIAESPSTLISVEKAIQNAYEIQNAIISTDKVTVTAIDFEYVPVSYNKNYDEVKLTPTWSLTLTYERDVPSKGGKEASESSVGTRIIFINAITGDEIK